MKPIALIILITGTLTLSAAKPPQLQQFGIQKPTAEWFGGSMNRQMPALAAYPRR